LKQLGIVDSAFVNLEHPNVPQHVGGLGLYDPSTADGGFVRFKQVLANFEERLKKVPMFRTRLVEVPLGLDRPYFVVDKNFDVEFHIRHIALPRPGDWRQLCIQVARLHARPLDMRRPLWEVYVIEGLDNVEGVAPGGFAVYTKMHHCLIDGAGGQDFMTVLHDFEPDPGPAKPEEIEPFSEAQPSDLGLAWRALGNHLGGAAGTARDTLGLFTDVLKTAYRIRSGDLPGYTSGGPKSRFDRPIGPHRVFDALSFRLDDIRAIKDRTRATVNDVVVAVVSGAVREYLLQKDELPAEPLALSMPVNMRTRKGESGDANQIGSIMSLIHTDVEDPLERLAKIQSSIGEAKKFIDTPLVDVQKLAGVFSPLIAKPAAGVYVGQGLTRLLPTGNCGIVTNIVGAPVQLYCAGARLTHYHCLGLLTPGCGLCHAAFSMNEELSLSFLANRDVMPDPDFYRDCLERSFLALRKASMDTGGRKKRSSKRAAARAKRRDVAPA
jgi:WS/DGAT/MGAT family acyltransferase